MRIIYLVDFEATSALERKVVDTCLERFGDRVWYLLEPPDSLAATVTRAIVARADGEPLLAVVIILGDWPVRVFTADPAKADQLRTVNVWATGDVKAMVGWSLCSSGW